MNDRKFDGGIRSLGLCGLQEREEQRVRKQQEMPTQATRGLSSAYPETRRTVDIQKLKQSDPAMAFFLTANRSFGTA